MIFRKFLLFLPFCLMGQTQQDYVKQIKNKPVLDVREYGAKGDGTTDDTASISSAISAACAGKTLNFPAGIYKVTGGFNISGCNGMRMYGNKGATKIRMAHASNDIFYWTSETRDLDLSGFTFVSDTITRTGGWIMRGICAYNANCFLRQSRISDNIVRNQVNGFWITQFELIWFENNNLNTWIGTGGIGVKIGQTSPAAYIQGTGFYFSHSSIFANDFYGAGTGPGHLAYGIWVEDCDALEVNGGEIGGVVENGLRMVANTQGIANHYINQLTIDTTANSHAVYITGTGIAARIAFDNCLIGNAGITGSGSGSDNANGMRIDVGTQSNIEIRNSRFGGSKGAGLYITATVLSDTIIIGNKFENNGTAGSVNNSGAIYVNTATDAIAPFITGNYDIGPNGVSLQTSATSNLVRLGTNFFNRGVTYGISPRSGVELFSSTVNLGGSPLTAGNCSSTTTTVNGVALGQLIITTPAFDPGDNYYWRSYVSGANTITTKVCAVTNGTPNATIYYVKAVN